MATRPVEIIGPDTRGRMIHVTTLSVTDQYRLRGCIRPELRSDDTAQALAQAAASVRQIGEVPVMFPKSVDDLEAIMDRLDDDGWSVVVSHMRTKMEAAAAALKEANGPLEPSAT